MTGGHAIIVEVVDIGIQGRPVVRQRKRTNIVASLDRPAVIVRIVFCLCRFQPCARARIFIREGV